MKIKLIYVLMVVAVLGIAGAASASDLAIYSGPTNAGWISNDTCQANTKTIMNDARMKKLFDAIDNFGDGTEKGQRSYGQRTAGCGDYCFWNLSKCPLRVAQ